VAGSIGWPLNSGFQMELAFAAIGIGLIGAIGFWRKSFWLPFIIAKATLMWGAGITHIIHILEQDNFSPSNTGMVVYWDFLLPVITHCFLNINTRFPQGCAFAGANVPVINTLLKYDLGIIQMPCPEFLCLGLEKALYGEIPASELRDCYRNIAGGVVDQIEAYLKLGYKISGIIGMNPSSSCGVETSKGKGTMLGLDHDTSEKEESGVFIEELIGMTQQHGIQDLPFFGIRRVLPGEEGIDSRIHVLDSYLSQV
jgi:predicted secreted protein